jgi:uncharacterized membrane protein (UPF0127 family)
MNAIRSVFSVLAIGAVLSLPALAQEARDTLTIVTATGSHPFKVETMRTDAELERGLMFRRKMAADRGMLCDFGSPRVVTMWMKNTYLPLDMVFIAGDGHVVSVKENAEPLSETTISSGDAALGVLEVNAGTAKRIGLKPGDSVENPMFKP